MSIFVLWVSGQRVPPPLSPTPLWPAGDASSRKVQGPDCGPVVSFRFYYCVPGAGPILIINTPGVCAASSGLIKKHSPALRPLFFFL